MTYRIELSTRAKADLTAIVDWNAARDTDAAVQWYRGFQVSLARLELSPERFAVAHELESLHVDVREYLYGSGRTQTHRVFFRVLAGTVQVLAIRHRAQRTVSEADLGLDAMER